MVAQAMRLGLTDEEIYTACKIDPWFLREMRGHRRDGSRDQSKRPAGRRPATLRRLKAMGFSDARLAALTGPPRTR